MGLLSFIDHVAITVADMDQTCAFYDKLFGSKILRDHGPVRVIVIGEGVRLSVHQYGNGVELVAARPTTGSVDICFRWSGSIDEAAAHLGAHGIEIIDGPSPRVTADNLPAQSVYFRDPDRNLVELLAAD